jgi:hypothetical protein
VSCPCSQLGAELDLPSANTGNAIANIIVATINATVTTKMVRLMYPPNVVAIPAGSPNQHRKALSGSTGRTDEQDLAVLRKNLRKSCVHEPAMNLSRTPVNWSKKEDRGVAAPALSRLVLQHSRLPCPVCDYLTHRHLGRVWEQGARFSATNCPALKLDCSSASLCSKTLVETMTPSRRRRSSKQRTQAFR